MNYVSLLKTSLAIQHLIHIEFIRHT